MKGNPMAFGKKRSERPFGCFMAEVRDSSCDGPTTWWLRSGCGHMTGESQVCDAHKTQIDQGDVPALFACSCGQPPILARV